MKMCTEVLNTSYSKTTCTIVLLTTKIIMNNDYTIVLLTTKIIMSNG